MAFTNVKSVVKVYSKKRMGSKPTSLNKTSRGHIEAVYPNGVRVHFKHAKEPFRKFGTVYSDVEYGGPGDSINLDKLENAVSRGTTFIVTGFGDGKVYQYPAGEWLDWAKENGTIRITQYQQNQEQTASIPLSLMERVDNSW